MADVAITLRHLLAVVVVVPLLGCSAQALKRTGYETLHNISDIQNDKDPKYDPSPRPSFETYQQQREEILREQRPEPPAPIAPASPVLR